MIESLTIFIGYDAREPEAFDVCRASLVRHSSIPLHIVKLDVAMLKHSGWYRRDWWQVGNDRVDLLDGKPFSTDFAFTRFLVPALSLYQGWALFCDGDFLFTEDIAKLFALADERYAVQCVKHEYEPVEATKMDGVSQGRYRRKNWSSLVLWNCAHPRNELLTGYVINEEPGWWLHGFNWLDDADIGELPAQWNWLAGVNKAPKKLPSGIHFTLGVPSMPGHENAPYADLWRAELRRITIRQEEIAA